MLIREKIHNKCALSIKLCCWLIGKWETSISLVMKYPIPQIMVMIRLRLFLWACSNSFSFAVDWQHYRFKFMLFSIHHGRHQLKNKIYHHTCRWLNKSPFLEYKMNVSVLFEFCVIVNGTLEYSGNLCSRSQR